MPRSERKFSPGHSSCIGVREGQESEVLRHAPVACGDFRDQLHRSVGTQTATQEQDAIRAIQKSQFLANNNCRTRKPSRIRLCEAPEFQARRQSPCSFNRNLLRRGLHISVAGDVLSRQHIVELHAAAAILLLQDIIEIRGDDKMREKRGQETHGAIERGVVVETKFVLDPLVQ